MHLEIGVEAIGFSRQQRLQFAARDFLFQIFQRGLSLGNDCPDRSRLRRVDHPVSVLELALDLAMP